MQMELSVDTLTICFSSGVQFSLVMGPECPIPLPIWENEAVEEILYTKISLVSVPNAMKLPEGETLNVRILYG